MNGASVERILSSKQEDLRPETVITSLTNIASSPRIPLPPKENLLSALMRKSRRPYVNRPGCFADYIQVAVASGGGTSGVSDSFYPHQNLVAPTTQHTNMNEVSITHSTSAQPSSPSAYKQIPQDNFVDNQLPIFPQNQENIISTIPSISHNSIVAVALQSEEASSFLMQASPGSHLSGPFEQSGLGSLNLSLAPPITNMQELNSPELNLYNHGSLQIEPSEFQPLESPSPFPEYVSLGALHQPGQFAPITQTVALYSFSADDSNKENIEAIAMLVEEDNNIENENGDY